MLREIRRRKRRIIRAKTRIANYRHQIRIAERDLSIVDQKINRTKREGGKVRAVTIKGRTQLHERFQAKVDKDLLMNNLTQGRKHIISVICSMERKIFNNLNWIDTVQNWDPLDGIPSFETLQSILLPRGDTRSSTEHNKSTCSGYTAGRSS